MKSDVLFLIMAATYAPVSKVAISGSFKTIIKPNGVLLSHHSHSPRSTVFSYP